MDLAFTHKFQAEPAKVVDLFRNEAFIADLAKHAGATSHSVSISDDATSLDMQLPTPANVATFIGKTVRLVMRFAFKPSGGDGSYQGNVDVDVPGMPVDVAAKAVLKPTAKGSEGVYSGTLKVKIPLVGKKAEAQIEPFIIRAFNQVEKRANHWLS
ncbi:DUF2505 domain-containing protein [Tessaracoccus caeni]|uniref:DUF2505 domain-containing protein n=1 Tax=Tessaracoccus caeni TaxID=3031239 RepID=UPI0023D9C181|nr:DUF2505 domain-containing protein [Tessaracoccus caeni]MDF1488449.1 DUF2505 domain-containing protein [Tessaracoccus caeni]